MDPLAGAIAIIIAAYHVYCDIMSPNTPLFVDVIGGIVKCLLFLPSIFLLVRGFLCMIPAYFNYFWPETQGYCYTCIYEPRYRTEAVTAKGRNPKLSNALDFPGVRKSAKFVVTKPNNSKFYHIAEDGLNGSTLDELEKTYFNNEFGFKSIYKIDSITRFEMYEQIQKYVRRGAWIFLIAWMYNYSDNIKWALYLVIGILAVLFRTDAVAYGIMAIAFADTIAAAIVGFFIYAVLKAFDTFVRIGLVDLFNTVAKVPEEKWKPSNQTYPVGDEGDAVDITYDLHSNNPFLHLNIPSVDDGLTDEENKLYNDRSGVATTKTEITGNSHALAATVTKLFRYLISRDCEGQPILNIGGTMASFNRSVSGVSLAPVLEDNDAYYHNKINVAEDIKLGRINLNRKMRTKYRPVGENDTAEDLDFDIKGLQKCNMVSIHGYDYGPKALMAIAAKLECPTVYVVVNFHPSMLDEKAGCLPWVKQRWVRRDDGIIEMSWEGTSNRVYRHKFHYLYEHMFTDFIKVTNNIWYTCVLHRHVGDTFLMRWSLTRSQPQEIESRRITSTKPHGYCRIPLLTRMDDTETLEFAESTKQHEDFLINTKSLAAANSSLRALIDNFKRNRGLIISHNTYNEVLSMYRAEHYIRRLASFAESVPVCSTLRETFGIDSDQQLMCGAASKIVRELKDQPSNDLEVKLLRQINPYVLDDNKPLPPRIFRRYTFDLFGNRGDLITSSIFSEVVCDRIIFLDIEGGEFHEKLCKALFSDSMFAPPILPMGEGYLGGSELANSGNKLLETELQYLMESQNIIFLMKESVGNGLLFYGNPVQDTDKEPVVIYLDPNSSLTTGRVAVLQVPRGRKVVEALQRDLCAKQDDQRWFYGRIENALNNGSVRRYRANANFPDLYLIQLREILQEQIDKCNQENIRNNIQNTIDNLREPDPLDLTNVNSIMDVPTFDQSQNTNYFRVYDRMNKMDEDTNLPPAHWYANRNIDGMHQMKYQN